MPSDHTHDSSQGQVTPTAAWPADYLTCGTAKDDQQLGSSSEFTRDLQWATLEDEEEEEEEEDYRF